MSGTRPYRSDDRAAATAALGDGRALEAPGSHAHVADGGASEGIALWLEPAPGELPYLGAVVVAAGAGRQQFYRLVLACARDAQSRGHTGGRFQIHDAALRTRIERDFRVDARPCGWEPNTDRPTNWEITVDLADAIEQLARVV